MTSQILEVHKQTNINPHNEKSDYQCSSIFNYKKKAYIFLKLKKQMQNHIVVFKDGQITYSCHRIFSLSNREIGSLTDILIQMDPNSLWQAQNYRFIGCCIESYPILTQRELVITHIAYGESIFEIYGENINRRIVSNCFIHDKQIFYFINNEQEQSQQKFALSQIRLSKNGKTCGIKISFGRIDICVATQYIFEGIVPKVRVKQEIMSSLQKVVYVRYQSSHCSGLLCEKGRVISVRHLFSSVPAEDAVVYVRIYPYSKERKAIIQPMPKINIDVITFRLIQEDQEDKLTKQKEIIHQYSQVLHKQSKKLHQGQKIYCMGFGKYSYNNYIFSKFDLVLPTITEGIISKIIDFSGEQVYFKTDSYLYNGYSGTPIWSDQKWIGLSIFILKNSNSSVKYPRHNFSYSSKFIEKQLNTLTPRANPSTFQQSLTFFQGIQTRRELTPKL